MKKLLTLLLSVLILTGCAAPIPAPTQPSSATEPTTLQTQPPTDPPTQPPTDPPDPLTAYVERMTTEEKVGQLFLARYDSANAAAHAAQYHIGGWILFSADFEGQTPETISAEISALQALSPVPMLMAVDEEGGTVTRVSRHAAFRESKFPSPRYLYQTGGEELLLETEAEKSALLASIGVNVNMAPVCDITTDPGAFMYSRSLGQDPETTGRLTAAMVEVMAQHQVGSVLKHFPGYGNNDDTHVGIAVDNRSLEALEAADLVPFRTSIIAGADAILVSHTIVEALDPDLPASLSPAVHAYLRNEMGFEGVIVTDDLVMQAITDAYGASEAAVLAVLAGNDLLCVTEYTVQYEAILQAVKDGRISQEMLDSAVCRVLRWKQELGLIAF